MKGYMLSVAVLRADLVGQDIRVGLALRKSTKSAGLFTEDLFAMIAKFREMKVWCMRDLLRLLKRTPVKMVGGM